MLTHSEETLILQASDQTIENRVRALMSLSHDVAEEESLSDSILASMRSGYREQSPSLDESEPG